MKIRVPIAGAEHIMGATIEVDIAPKGTRLGTALERGYVLVNCNSHRSRQGLIGGRDSNAQGYYSFKRASKGGFYAVWPDKLPRKGVTKLRGPFDDIAMCWG